MTKKKLGELLIERSQPQGFVLVTGPTGSGKLRFMLYSNCLRPNRIQAAAKRRNHEGASVIKTVGTNMADGNDT
ncbi:MAG: hypothetical protein WA666_01030 [Nitrospirota bacterium]